MTDNRAYQFHWKSFVAPRYWPSWVGILLLWLLSRLPFDLQLAVGRMLGRLVWYAIPSRRRVTLINLGLAFPQNSREDNIALARKVYDHVGMSIAEGASFWFRPAEFFAERFELHGLEHLDEALRSDRGVILLQPHFSVVDITSAIIGPLYPVSVVFDEPKNKLFATLLANRRARYLQGLIDNRQMRRMVRKLKNGGIVWYSPDQSVARSHGGIETTFFAQPVLTTSGTSRIAKMSGARIMTFVPTRHAESGRYTLTFGQTLLIESTDEIAATQQVNDVFEAQIRAQPEQYFWIHKRFKPPSPEHANPYKI